jgi:hypothetical protein
MVSFSKINAVKKKIFSSILVETGASWPRGRSLFSDLFNEN